MLSSTHNVLSTQKKLKKNQTFALNQKPKTKLIVL